MVIKNAALLSAWDVVGFLNSLGKYLGTVGKALIVAIGFGLLLFGLWHLFKKLTATQPGGGEGWGKIAAQIIIGGAMALGGGWGLYTDVAKGAGDTIKQAGGSFIDVTTLAHAVQVLLGF